jgi:hypothetical protein
VFLKKVKTRCWYQVLSFSLYHSTGRSYPAVYARSVIDCVILPSFFGVLSCCFYFMASHFVTNEIADNHAEQKQEGRLVTGVQK